MLFRPKFLLSALLAAVAFLPAHAATRPNILLILSDDQGYGDTTANGPTDLETPFIDSIAHAGIRFTHFRVNPLCAPTRASVMTGLYSIECGMWRGPSDPAGAAAKAGKKTNPRKAAKAAKAATKSDDDDDDTSTAERRIPREIQLLPQYLKAAGYATGIFGKWHLGSDPQSVPNARGFDEFVGFLGGAHPYVLARNSRVEHNGKPLTEPNPPYTTDLFADRAIAFIKANRDKPFFCYVPFNAVHGPLHREDAPRDSAKPEWLAHYEKRGIPQPRRDYNAVMTHADSRIGDLLKTLRDLDLEKNTLVIFHSDNGGILHTYPSNNGGLRGGKGETYEGGLRVPAMMQWPGVIPAGVVSSADAAHFDVFATILDAAGVALPAKNGPHPLRGVSLLPHLKSGGRTGLPDRYLFFDLYGDCGAQHGPWKLVGQIENHRGRFAQAADEAAKTKFELYNLQDDPAEKTNLADRHPDIYNDLKSRHLAWLRAAAK
ncbi:MAG: sulfatase-like hydrolase/transferase [Verrucomicrobiota bacterium]